MDLNHLEVGEYIFFNKYRILKENILNMILNHLTFLKGIDFI